MQGCRANASRCLCVHRAFIVRSSYDLDPKGGYKCKDRDKHQTYFHHISIPSPSSYQRCIGRFMKITAERSSSFHLPRPMAISYVLSKTTKNISFFHLKILFLHRLEPLHSTSTCIGMFAYSRFCEHHMVHIALMPCILYTVGNKFSNLQSRVYFRLINRVGNNLISVK